MQPEDYSSAEEEEEEDAKGLTAPAVTTLKAASHTQDRRADVAALLEVMFAEGTVVMDARLAPRLCALIHGAVDSRSAFESGGVWCIFYQLVRGAAVHVKPGAPRADSAVHVPGDLAHWRYVGLAPANEDPLVPMLALEDNATVVDTFNASQSPDSVAARFAAAARLARELARVSHDARVGVVRSPHLQRLLFEVEGLRHLSVPLDAPEPVPRVTLQMWGGIEPLGVLSRRFAEAVHGGGGGGGDGNPLTDAELRAALFQILWTIRAVHLFGGRTPAVTAFVDHLRAGDVRLVRLPPTASLLNRTWVYEDAPVAGDSTQPKRFWRISPKEHANAMVRLRVRPNDHGPGLDDEGAAGEERLVDLLRRRRVQGLDADFFTAVNGDTAPRLLEHAYFQSMRSDNSVQRNRKETLVASLNPRTQPLGPPLRV